MKLHAFTAILLSISLLLSGCSTSGAQTSTTTSSVPGTSTAATTGATTAATTAAVVSAGTAIDTSDLFSGRDFQADFDAAGGAVITLNGDSASCTSNAVKISGSTVTITDEGTYILSGTLNNGMIVVNAEKSDKTQLVLNGVTIHSETSAPIYILQADKVFITLAEGSQNTLSNGGAFTAIDDNNIDAVIFSKEDVTCNGSGTLTIASPAGHGIVSKDELTVTGGTYDITAASHGIAGKDNVCIAGGTFTIASGKDGIHAENNDDTTLGFVYVQNGTFTIAAEGDGLSAAAQMQIDGGSFSVTSGGGSVNAEVKTSDAWGNFGGRGGMGMGGGRGGMGGFGGTVSAGTSADTSTDTSEDSTSIKGIKASGNLVINGGTFQIDAADDAIHSNASVTVGSGTFTIASGDDAFHADDTLTILAGTIDISESYEGLEGLHIIVSGGDIRLVASDDGLNAAGGTDASGFGGVRGGDTFGGRGGMGMGGASNGSIVISGGTLYIVASGDGIDANGTLAITDGNITVCGPSSGDTATLDYDTSAVISGGTFIGTGGSMMAQTFSDADQGVVAVSVGNQSAGANIELKDSSGKTLISYTPELSFGVIIFSSPDIVSGQAYDLTVGTLSGTVTAS